jgi:hypothetical protein
MDCSKLELGNNNTYAALPHHRRESIIRCFRFTRHSCFSAVRHCEILASVSPERILAMCQNPTGESIKINIFNWKTTAVSSWLKHSYWRHSVAFGLVVVVGQMLRSEINSLFERKIVDMGWMVIDNWQKKRLVLRGTKWKKMKKIT